MNLVEQLHKIPDYRHMRGRRHELWLVLLLILLGAMTGYWGYRPLASFTLVHREQLINLLKLPPTVKFPSYSTFRRVILQLDFQPFTDLFNNWAAITIPALPGERLAIDGKGIRCNVTDYNQSYQNFISVVSVYSHSRGIVLRTQPMYNKLCSEVAIVQELILELSGQSVVFTLDALHCKKKTVALIVNSGNDYSIGLKANQPTLYQLAGTLEKANAPLSCATSKDDTHSRSVNRDCKVFAVPEKVSNKWAGLKTIILVERTGYRQGKFYQERQFYISSLIQSADEFLADIRGHWGIENRLHWVRDVTFTEDFPIRRGGQSPVNWAILHIFFITLARLLGFRTIPQAQRALSNQQSQVFSLLSNQPTVVVKT